MNNTMLFQLRADELSAMMENAVLSALAQQAKPEPQKEADELLTQAEACKLLRITKPTIIRLEKQGHITPRRMGRRVLYSKNAILERIQKGVRYA